MVLHVLKWSKTPIYSWNEYPRPLSMQFNANGTTWPMVNWFKWYILLAIAQYTYTYLQSLYSITFSWRVLHIIFSMSYYSCCFLSFSLIHKTKVFKSLNKLFLSISATSSKGPVWDTRSRAFAHWHLSGAQPQFEPKWHPWSEQNLCLSLHPNSWLPCACGQTKRELEWPLKLLVWDLLSVQEIVMREEASVDHASLELMIEIWERGGIWARSWNLFPQLKVIW